MTDEVFGLTLQQHQAVERIWRETRMKTRALPYISVPDRRNDKFARLINIGPEFPVYNPFEPRPVGLFELSRVTKQLTVKFYGENLRGDVFLQIDDLSWRINCQSTSFELTNILSLNDCRITCFPGLWEFAFGTTWDELPLVTCEPYYTDAPVRFLGGCVVTNEAWRSVTVDGIKPATVEVIDCIPYLEGELKLGAMAIGTKFGDGVYVASQWSCPAFSFWRG